MYTIRVFYKTLNLRKFQKQPEPFIGTFINYGFRKIFLTHDNEKKKK